MPAKPFTPALDIAAETSGGISGRLAVSVILILIGLLSGSLQGCLRDVRTDLIEPGPHSTIRRGAHFRVVLHFESPGGAEQALATAEAAWPHAVEFFGVGGDPLDPPLSVHIYSSSSDYRRVEKALTGGRFRRHLAFSHLSTRTAHIALQPHLTAEAIERLGLPAQTLRLVAHEASHVASYHAYHTSLWMPEWLDEGVACWIEQQVMIARGLSPLREEDDPWASTYLWRVTRLLEDGRLPPAIDIFRDHLGGLDRVQRYALRKVFFSFLRTDDHLDGQRAVLRRVRELDGGPGFAGELLREVRSIFGSETLEPLDRDFRLHVSRFRPGWIERRRSLQCSGDAWQQIAFPTGDALAWRTEAPESDRYRMIGSVEVLRNTGRRMHLYLGRSSTGHLDIRFEVGHGLKVFFRAERPGGRAARRLLGEIRSPNMEFDRRVPFEVRVIENEIRIRLAEEAPLRVEVEGLDPRGPWGLGASRGTAGVWHSLRIEDLGK